MGEIVLVVIVLVLLGLTVWGAVRLARRNRGRQAEQQRAAASGPVDPFGSGDVDALRGDPRQLRAGGIVEIRGRDYTVRGSLRLTEDGWSWDEHFLDDAKGERAWLSVEEDPELEMVLFTTLPDAEVRPGTSVELDGRTYRRSESGIARFTAEGTTGLDPSGTLRYHDYAADDGSRLSLEAYGSADEVAGDGDGKWEVSRGEVLSRYEVRVFPASAE